MLYLQANLPCIKEGSHWTSIFRTTTSRNISKVSLRIRLNLQKHLNSSIVVHDKLEKAMRSIKLLSDPTAMKSRASITKSRRTVVKKIGKKTRIMTRAVTRRHTYAFGNRTYRNVSVIFWRTVVNVLKKTRTVSFKLTIMRKKELALQNQPVLKHPKTPRQIVGWLR